MIAPYSGITVVCVYWEGDFRKREYSPEWVRRLRNMVARNLPLPHRFVCLSNVEVEGVETARLVCGWPGWWAKMELFSHDFGGRVLYFDLDTLIVDDLSDIANFPAPFAALPPSYRFTGGNPAGGLGVVDKINSSVMTWDCDMWDLFAEFADRADAWMDLYRGDQDFIGDKLATIETLPPEWFQKLRYRTQGPQGEKVILSMPWKNEEAARRFEWVRNVWQ